MEKKKNMSDNLNVFINNNFKISTNFKALLCNIRLFIMYINNNGYKLTDEDIAKLLIENTTFRRTIKNIMSNPSDLQDDIFANDLYQKIIVVYCERFEMPIIEQELDEEEIYGEVPAALQYHKDILNMPILSNDAINKLIIDAQLGDARAYNKIVESNLRLVYFVAKKFKNQGVSFEDLIQEGNMTLIKTVPKYDVNSRMKFSTFAYMQVFYGLKAVISRSGQLIALPYEVNLIRYRLSSVIDKLAKELGKYPNSDELAKELNISKEQMEAILRCDGYSSLNDQDESIDAEELIERIPNSDPLPEEILLKKEFKEIFARFLNEANLTEREKEILFLKFIDGCPLRQIGDKYNICHQRVSQIINRAIEKLRNYKDTCDKKNKQLYSNNIVEYARRISKA